MTLQLADQSVWDDYAPDGAIAADPRVPGEFFTEPLEMLSRSLKLQDVAWHPGATEKPEPGREYTVYMQGNSHGQNVWVVGYGQQGQIVCQFEGERALNVIDDTFAVFIPRVSTVCKVVNVLNSVPLEISHLYKMHIAELIVENFEISERKTS